MVALDLNAFCGWTCAGGAGALLQVVTEMLGAQLDKTTQWNNVRHQPVRGPARAADHALLRCCDSAYSLLVHCTAVLGSMCREVTSIRVVSWGTQLWHTAMLLRCCTYHGVIPWALIGRFMCP